MAEPMYFEFETNGRSDVVNFEEENWKYYKCDPKFKPYYECMAEELSKIKSDSCPTSCKPIQYRGLLNHIPNSTLPDCTTYAENACIANVFLGSYYNTDGSITKKCPKWCSGTQHVGFKIVTDEKGNYYEDGQVLMDLYLVAKSTTVKIHSEYRVYDEIGLVASIGGSLGLFVGFSFYDLICQIIDKAKDYYVKKRVNDYNASNENQ